MIGKNIIEWLEETWNLDNVCKNKDDLKFRRTTRFDYEYFKKHLIGYIDQEVNKLQQPEVDPKDIVNKLETNEFYKNIIDGDIILIINRHDDDDISQYEYVSKTHGYCMDLVDTFENKFIKHNPNVNDMNILHTMDQYRNR